MSDGNGLWFTGELEQRRVQTSKGQVEYVDIGQGPAILYFHGNDMGNDSAVMMEKSLLDEGFRLIAPNRPGYFGTAISCGRTPEDCADVAAELLQQIGVQRVVVIGTSAGGAAACRFAGKHGAKTAALVLQCGLSHSFDAGKWMPRGVGWLLPVFRHIRFFMPLLRFGHKQQAKRVDNGAFVAACMSKGRYKELRETEELRTFGALMAKCLRRCSVQPAGFENDWMSWTGAPWLTPGAVKCPTLILHDREDPVVQFIHAEWSKECIPQAELCELQVGGHLIWIGRDAEKMRRERGAFIRRQVV